MTNTELYETDFHAWTQETARLLREEQIVDENWMPDA